jgi:hypothetical protein
MTAMSDLGIVADAPAVLSELAKRLGVTGPSDRPDAGAPPEGAAPPTGTARPQEGAQQREGAGHAG